VVVSHSLLRLQKTLHMSKQLSISLANDYLLLEADTGTSQFSSHVTGSFFVVFPAAEYRKGQKVYLYPGDYPKMMIDGTEYTVAKLDDIVGVRDAT